MNKITLVCLMLAASAQAASAQVAKAAAHYVGQRDPFQDYWEREAWAGTRYYGNIEFSAKDMDELSEKVQKLLGASGAKLISVNTFKPEAPQIQQRQRARRTFGYKIPAERGEEIAKKLSALAPVDSYNVNSQMKGQPNPAQEVKERIDALEAEMEQNKEALKNMPIARALYASKLERLKRTQESSGDPDEMQFNISVTQADRP
jgi:hypothetical protein